MQHTHPKWQWQKGTVDPNKAHIEIRYGNASESGYSDWQSIALIGKPENHVFPVQWLIDPEDQDKQDIIKETCRDLDFYLVDKEEPDPWAYAKYHCNTSANMYSPVHWSYFPDGQRGQRHSSMVFKLPGRCPEI